MSERDAKAPPLFAVSNHHVADSGAPPQIDGDREGAYHAYFENRFGEQLLFVYDREAETGVLRMGDAGWENAFAVEDGFASVTLDPPESYWLMAAWSAATGTPIADVMRASGDRAQARAEAIAKQVEAAAVEAGADPEEVRKRLREHLGAGPS